jgi:hypothetical protein
MESRRDITAYHHTLLSLITSYTALGSLYELTLCLSSTDWLKPISRLNRQRTTSIGLAQHLGHLVEVGDGHHRTLPKRLYITFFASIPTLTANSIDTA